MITDDANATVAKLAERGVKTATPIEPRPPSPL
jgi:hypothetical protein